MMTTKPTCGIYIHIPFCKRKCLYCDFCSYTNIEESVFHSYVDALLKELQSYRNPLEEYIIDTIYIGGGTPSILPKEDLRRLLLAIKELFYWSEDYEFTVEVNPAVCDLEKLNILFEMGVNRISCGVQSFKDIELQKLGRLHTSKEAGQFLTALPKIGFYNFSLDLMYNIPNQTQESFKESLEEALSYNPTHISCYSLIIEEGTPFKKMESELHLMSEDEEVSMYEGLYKELAKNGYLHYEVSNYGKKGYESRHNLRYWRMQPYIGVGVAAHSFFENRRYAHNRSLEEYFKQPLIDYKAFEEENEETLQYETVMLGLRTKEGISRESFFKRFGRTFEEYVSHDLDTYLKHNILILEEDHYHLTDSAFYVMNEVLRTLLPSI